MAKAPPPPPPFSRSAAAKVLIVLVSLALIYVLVRKLEKINNHHQVVRSLAKDEPMSARVESLKKVVAQNVAAGKNGAPDRAMALYAGIVKKFDVGAPLNSQQPTRTLYLEKPVLLAGQPCRDDTSHRVMISYKSAPSVENTPKTGQWWIVAVSRDSSGNNVVHSASHWQAAMQ